jgi:hypothetical protein
MPTQKIRLTTDNVIINLETFDFGLLKDSTNPNESILYMNLVGVLSLLEQFATPELTNFNSMEDIATLRQMYVLNSEILFKGTSKFNVQFTNNYSKQFDGIYNPLFTYEPFNLAAQKVLGALKSGTLLLQFTDDAGDDINHGVLNTNTTIPVLFWQFPTDTYKFIQEGRIAVFLKMISHIWMLSKALDLNLKQQGEYVGPVRQTFITARKLAGEFMYLLIDSGLKYKEELPEWILQDIVLFLLSQLEEKAKAWYVATFHMINYNILPHGEYVDDLQILSLLLGLKSNKDTKLRATVTISQLLDHKKYNSVFDKEFLNHTQRLLQVIGNQ